MTDKLVAALAAINTRQTIKWEAEKHSLERRLCVLDEAIRAENEKFTKLVLRQAGAVLGRQLRGKRPWWKASLSVVPGLRLYGAPLRHVEVITTLCCDDLKVVRKCCVSTDADLAVEMGRLVAFACSWHSTLPSTRSAPA